MRPLDVDLDSKYGVASQRLGRRDIFLLKAILVISTTYKQICFVSKSNVSVWEVRNAAGHLRSASCILIARRRRNEVSL